MIARRTRDDSRTTSEGAISPRDRRGRASSALVASERSRRTLDHRGGEPLLPVAEPAHHFLLDVAHELVHLVLHLGHALAQVEDDLDAGEVHAQFARQGQDRFETLEVLIRVEARVAIGARRTQQALAFVEPQRLRMDVVALGDGADHVQRLAGTTGRHRSAFRLHHRAVRWSGPWTRLRRPGRAASSPPTCQWARTSSGCRRANSCISSRPPRVDHRRQHQLHFEHEIAACAGAARRHAAFAQAQSLAGLDAGRYAHRHRAVSGGHDHPRPEHRLVHGDGQDHVQVVAVRA